MKNQNNEAAAATEYKVLRDTCKYDILTRGDGTRGIKCKRCGMISWHPLDVKYKYCNNCRLFICLITEAFGGWTDDEDNAV